jgi:hypothetical protein
MPLFFLWAFVVSFNTCMAAAVALLFSFEKKGKQMKKQETSRKKRRRTAIVKERVKVPMHPQSEDFLHPLCLNCIFFLSVSCDGIFCAHRSSRFPK